MRMSARDPDGRIGTVLDGRYKVIEPLSRGGMGVVYRAERVPVGRQVAVKFLHALFADDKDSRARFERETRALSKLAHPHCVSIIDFGYDGAPYLVMDLVTGKTLREILDEGPIPIEEAAKILGKSVRTLENWFGERKLMPEPVKIGGSRYWHPAVFYQWLDSRLKGQPSEVQSRDVPMQQQARANAEGIGPRQTASDKKPAASAESRRGMTARARSAASVQSLNSL